MDLFYYVNMIICCFFSGCMCSWRFVYSTSHIEVIHHWLLVGGIQVGSVEVITMCYIFRDSVVCLWWIYEMCSICNSCRWFTTDFAWESCSFMDLVPGWVYRLVFTKIFWYVMCVYSIMYTKFTDFVIGSLNQPYCHLFAQYWLGTIFSSFAACV